MSRWADLRWQVLILRVALGGFFSYFLVRYFMPGASWGSVIALAAIVVFFAYLFESLRKR